MQDKETKNKTHTSSFKIKTGPKCTFLQRRYTNVQKAHERCSRSLVVKETMRYHFISTSQLKIF